MTMHASDTKRGPRARNERPVLAYLDPLTDDRWDRFVGSHPYGWITHTSTWKRIVEESFDHMEGYYPALVGEQSGEIRAALPLFQVKSWLTGRKLVSIPWATIADPLVSCREDFDLLATEARTLALKLGATHLELRALQASSLVQRGDLAEGNHYLHHYLYLDRDLERLQRTFHRSCIQQRIKKSLKSGLSWRFGHQEQDLKILYAMHVKNRKSKCLPPQPYRFFRNVWQRLLPEKRVSLLIAELHGKPVASLLLFKFKERISAEVAHMDEEYRPISPNIYLFWQAILQGVDEGYRIFDFGRTAPDNLSLANFKSRWGTCTADISFFYFPQEKTRELTARYASRYSLVQWLCKHMPEPLLPHLGSFCYRHTG